VGDPVVDAVNGVVRLVLEGREDVGVVLDQVDVDCLDVASSNESQAGVARCRDDVELLGVCREQAERLVGRTENLNGDLAAAGVLERLDPVDRFVGRSVFDVARPRQHGHFAFAFADRRREARLG
jgi:hypothetical protein